MKTIAIDAESLLARVSPGVAAAYLTSGGWRRVRGYRWRAPCTRSQCLVDARVDQPGYLVERLAWYENRSPLAVLADLIGADAVRSLVEACIGPDPRLEALRQSEFLANAVYSKVDRANPRSLDETGKSDADLAWEGAEHVAGLLGVRVYEWIGMEDPDGDPMCHCGEPLSAHRAYSSCTQFTRR